VSKIIEQDVLILTYKYVSLVPLSYSVLRLVSRLASAAVRIMTREHRGVLKGWVTG
jgi:hypothetical protein